MAPDRRNDQENRDRIAYIQRGYERTSHLLWRALAIVIVAVLIESFFLWKAYGDIQSSRIAACQETNQRNDATISGYRREVKRLLAKTSDPATRARIRANIGANIRLIETLVPRRPKLVRKRDPKTGKIVVVEIGPTCQEFARSSE